MKLVGLMPVRNEAWILGLSARVALQWCDELVVGLHNCEDLSETIADGVNAEAGTERLHMIDNHGETWDEMRHRQRLLEEARILGATHIALVDADEVLTADLVPKIRAMVEGTPSGHILYLPMYWLRGGVGTYHANGLWGNRTASVAFPDLPELHWGGDRFHHREPMGRALTVFNPVGQGDGGVLHFWGASERRLKAKHALYKVTERLRWPNKSVREIDRVYSMWRDSTRTGGDDPKNWAYSNVPLEWIPPYIEHLHVDSEPWQEAEVRRLISEHGRERFEGLELFGADV